MPTLTRESRALLSLVLAAAFLVGGLGDIASTTYAAVVGLVPGDGPPFVPLAFLSLAVAVVVLALAWSAARTEAHDVWHHLAVTATWLALLQVVLGVLAVIGALAGTWPDAPMFGWTT